MIYAQLFVTFFKIGLFSFGGGMAMLPLIEREIVKIHGWLAPSDFVDIVGIAEMTPGPIAINSATFVGYRVAGVAGSLVSSFALIMPSLIIVSIMYWTLQKLSKTKALNWILKGLRPVVVGLIAAAFLTILPSSIVDIKSFILALGIFLLSYFKKIHPILALGIAAACGIIFF